MVLNLAIFAHLSRFTSDSVSLTGEFSTKFQPENNDFDLYKGFFMGKNPEVARFRRRQKSKSSDFYDKF
jgi:hypothetical protein